MSQNPASIVTEYQQQIDQLKKELLKTTQDFKQSQDLVEHHILACQLKHKPVNLKILASYPQIRSYIRRASHIQSRIVTLSKIYQQKLKDLT